jgi:nitroreductase
MYKSQPVDKAKLNLVLEAARIAPSAANRQPWHFIIVEDPENLEKVSSSYGRDWLKTAPLIIVCCGDHQEAWKRKSDNKDHTDIDLSIAIDHMTLQATESGLATCWICHFDAEMIKDMFKLPRHIEPIALLPLGYPDDKVNPHRHGEKRKAIEHIVHYEKW